MAFVSKPKKAEEPIREIGKAFSRESLLAVYGGLDRLRKEYGGKYLKMPQQEFEKLRAKKAMEQARWLALRDPQIDDALERHEKRNKADAKALHFNIELALSNGLVKKAIKQVNEENKNAKSYARLMVEWKTDNFLKEAGITIVKLPFMIMPVGCGGEEVSENKQGEQKPEIPVPKATREYGEAERTALMGAQMGIPVPNFYPSGLSTTQGKSIRALVFGGDDLPLLRDQSAKGRDGDVLVTQKIYVQTRVNFDQKEGKLSFMDFRHPAAAIEFSGPLAVGSEFSILGRKVKVAEVSQGLLTLETAQGKRVRIGTGNDVSGLLGTTNIEGTIRSDANGGVKALYLFDKRAEFATPYQYLKGDSLLILNTFGFDLRNMDLKDGDYTYIRIDKPPTTAPATVTDSSGAERQAMLATRVATGSASFTIDGKKTNEFYLANVQSTDPSKPTDYNEYRIVYRPVGSNKYVASDSTAVLYTNPGGEQSEISLVAGKGQSTIVFNENSGRAGNDQILCPLTGYGSSPGAAYDPKSVTKEEQGPTGSGIQYSLVSEFHMTYRGSQIFVGKDAVEIYSANRVGRVVVAATQ